MLNGPPCINKVLLLLLLLVNGECLQIVLRRRPHVCVLKHCLRFFKSRLQSNVLRPDVYPFICFRCLLIELGTTLQCRVSMLRHCIRKPLFFERLYLDERPNHSHKMIFGFVCLP